MIINISQKIIDKCIEFGQNCVKTNNYTGRGQYNTQLIVWQIIYGKVAEFAVEKYLTEYCKKNTSSIDLNIYPTSQKSYSADLICLGKNIHIKSQTTSSANIHGLSWCFTSRDNIPDYDIIFFCESKSLSRVDVIGYCFAIKVKNQYKPTQLKHLKNKKVLYFDDIKNLIKLVK